MALFDEASPICRGKNLSWETVLLFFNNMPREAMPKAEFNSYVESRINAWTQTHSQIARQLAFYYEDHGVCYPRFTQNTSLLDLFTYMQNWATRYFIPNPYTPSLKGKVPTCIYSFIVNAIKEGKTDIDEILNSIFQIELSSHDKVIVYLSNFTGLLIEGHQVSINKKVGIIDSELHPNEENANDSKKYFDYFTLPQNNKTDYKLDELNKQKYHQIYYGAPGTGKSHVIKENTKGKEVIRTTFHPDSDYSTFVGAYKPTTIEVPMRDVTGKIIVENGKQVTEKRIVYEFVEQAFLQAYIKAWNLYAETEEGKTAEEVYLVIEEINRGNCAQIFGDLFQLLDRGDDGFSEYPIVADKDLQKQLEKSFADMASLNVPAICDMSADIVAEKIKKGEILLLPSNLYIWATMNTSDQSLFPIDSAFKRRWDWKYVPISDGKKNYVIEVDGDQYDWWSFLNIINDLIEDSTRSEDKKLGYFFAKAKDGIITSESFVNKIIFYLWNDVFKDNEIENRAFKTENGDMLAFRKFFHQDGSINTDTVIKFLQDLEVDPFENNGISTAPPIITTPNTKRARDKSRYRVNTTDNLNKAQMTREAFRSYIESHPDADANAIAQAWNGLGLKGIVQHLVETEEEFIDRTKDSQDTNKRAVEYILGNEEKIYLSTQFGIGNIDKFIDAINNAGWNIRIDKTA